ncbi:hypothetical protein M8J76_001786 [Diaphorina citri]|nr:hypothetical protein M8J76_001786 [Diaphorina citri]
MTSSFSKLLLLTLLISPTLSSPPLYITPLLNSGRYLEAQQRSHVTEIIPGVPDAGYSGFFTIDATRGTHLHFWFQPKENCSHWQREPLVLWLQGGWGGTSFRGSLLEQLFPYWVSEDGSVGRSESALSKHVNVLWIETTNVGFSYTEDPNYILTNFDMIAEEQYAGLTQFFTLFPDLNRTVFIYSASVGAPKGTALAQLILKRNRTVVDVGGVIYGDGLLDRDTESALVGDYFYSFGLLEKAAARNLDNRLEQIHAAKMSGDFRRTTDEARGVQEDIIPHIGFPYTTDVQDIMHAFRINDSWTEYMLKSHIRDKLHVGDLPFTVQHKSSFELLQASQAKLDTSNLAAILNHRVPMLKYHGQYDGLIDYQSTMITFYAVDWYGRSCLRTKQFARSQVWISGRLFGYWRQCYGLWELLVLRAAHVVPLAVPRPLWTFVSKFITEASAATRGI